MTNLSEFLLARIADDEDLARTFLADNHAPLLRAGASFRETTVAFVARVLAECDVKRQIVEGHAETWELGRVDYMEGVWRSEDHSIRLLAAVYADHPDYRQEWTP